MWPRVPSGSLASSVSRTACTVVARGCRVSASTWGGPPVHDQVCLSPEAPIGKGERTVGADKRRYRPTPTDPDMGGNQTPYSLRLQGEGEG